MRRYATYAVAVVLVASCGGNNHTFPGTGAGGSSSGSGGDDGGGGVHGFGDDGGTLPGFGDAGGGHPSPGGPVTKDDCTGKLAPSTIAALKGGGPVDPAMKWLYPYDKTVFPGGILPPLLQWNPQSGGGDAVLLHLKSSLFDYTFCGPPTKAGQLALDATAWQTAWAQNSGAGDPLSVELTTRAGGAVSGPIKETWIYALGSLKGVVYYNTYTSPQVNNNGAVMVIAPGAAKPTALLSIPGTSPIGPCISCHSVSADGATLVAQRHVYPPGLVQSEAYDLGKTPTPNPNAPLATSKTDDWGFSALYPDGSRLLTDGAPGQTQPIFPAGAGSNPGMEGPFASQMYDPQTGATVPFSGLSAKYAKMPMFSPDGKHVVFNDHDASNGHALVVQEYDRSHDAFANQRTIYQDATLYPGWPFFTPDGKSVVFVAGDSANYASLYNPPAPQVAKGDLWIVDLATGKAHTLDGANGIAGGASYLPYPGRDEHLSFFPTGSPVAAGGYFWVFFTSRRNYGNAIVGAVEATASKKIWVSAVSIGAPAGGDPSHPAFYLSGQEDASGNIRAFAALEPCKADGATCASGIDCCGGSCTGGQCGTPQGCSKVDEKCTTSADCCQGGQVLQCINGFCAFVAQ